MITGEGGTAVAHAADLTDEAQAREMVAAALDRFGRLDFLDNNVGIGSTEYSTVEPEAAPVTFRLPLLVILSVDRDSGVIGKGDSQSHRLELHGDRMVAAAVHLQFELVAIAARDSAPVTVSCRPWDRPGR